MQTNGEDLFWRQNNKFREILLISALAGMQLQPTTFFYLFFFRDFTLVIQSTPLDR